MFRDAEQRAPCLRSPGANDAFETAKARSTEAEATVSTDVTRGSKAARLGFSALTNGRPGMDHGQFGLDQTDENVFDYEISDEALEVASGVRAGEIATLMYGSYCFTCAPDGPIS